MIGSFIAVRVDPDQRRQLHRGLWVVGLILCALGAIALLAPTAAGLATDLVIGWILFLVGGLQIAHALSRHRGHAPWRGVLLGILAAAIGLFLVLQPVSGAMLLTLLVAVVLLADGGLSLAAAWSGRGDPAAPLLGLSGALGTLLGISMLILLPQAAPWLLGLLVGLALIGDGISALLLARRLR